MGHKYIESVKYIEADADFDSLEEVHAFYNSSHDKAGQLNDGTCRCKELLCIPVLGNGRFEEEAIRIRQPKESVRRPAQGLPKLQFISRSELPPFQRYGISDTSAILFAFCCLIMNDLMRPFRSRCGWQ